MESEAGTTAQEQEEKEGNGIMSRQTTLGSLCICGPGCVEARAAEGKEKNEMKFTPIEMGQKGNWCLATKRTSSNGQI